VQGYKDACPAIRMAHTPFLQQGLVPRQTSLCKTRTTSSTASLLIPGQKKTVIPTCMNACVRVCVGACVCACVQVHVRVRVCMRMCVCVCVCQHACVCACVHAFGTSVCAHACMCFGSSSFAMRHVLAHLSGLEVWRNKQVQGCRDACPALRKAHTCLQHGLVPTYCM